MSHLTLHYVKWKLWEAARELFAKYEVKIDELGQLQAEVNHDETIWTNCTDAYKSTSKSNYMMTLIFILMKWFASFVAQNLKELTIGNQFNGCSQILEWKGKNQDS